MLTGNEFYVVLKLSTGEQLMGILEQEDETHMQIISPMIIRTIPVPSEGREHVTAHPYCQFTDDNVFDIDKKYVIYIKPLKEIMIPHYKKIVMQHENEGQLETATEMTAEEARKRIKMLANIFGEELEEVLGEEEEEKPTTWYFDGNETKH
jgi:hypothetical protein